MSFQKVLYFFPENPLENNAGNKTRALQLLQYFKDREIEVDFVSLLQGMSKWDEQDVEKFKQSGLINNLYFIQKKPSKKNRIKYFLKFKIPNYFFKRKMSSSSMLNKHISCNQKAVFERILKGRNYTHIIISYLYWSELINSVSASKSMTIIDTHDLLTLHHFQDKAFQLGATFEDEINKLNSFDMAWTVSSDEQFVFSQFSKTSIKLVPPYFSRSVKGTAIRKKTHDLIYVASDNPHNQLSVSWFFEKVFPLLRSNISIYIVGKICAYVQEYPNVQKIPYARNLQDFYEISKIALCPMLTGTGVKIKVVEALSYGLPVVCTSRGVDGLPSKINNGCLISDEPEGFAQHIHYLLDDEEAYLQQSRMGEALFGNFFETQIVYKELDKLFRESQATFNQ